MPEREEPKYLEAGGAAGRAAEVVRKLPARRLLVATIGAATLQFVGGCKSGSYVANLMAAPNMPVAGQGQRADPQSGAGYQGSAAGYYVANLMAPPLLPQSGVGGPRGAAGVSGRAGSSGAAGAAGADHTDAGVDDDAGHA